MESSAQAATSVTFERSFHMLCALVQRSPEHDDARDAFN